MSNITTRASVILDVSAEVAQAKGAIAQLQNELKNEKFQIDISEAKGLFKMITNLKSHLNELEIASSHSLTGLKDTKKIQAEQKKVVDLINQIQLELNELSNYRGGELNKLFPGLGEKLDKINSGFNKFNITVEKSKNEITKAEKEVDKFTKKVEEHKQKLDEANKIQAATPTELKDATEARKKAEKALDSERATLQEYILKLKEAKAAREALQVEEEKAPKTSTGKIDKRTKIGKDLTGRIVQSDLNIENAEKQLNNQRVALQKVEKAYNAAAVARAKLVSESEKERKVTSAQTSYDNAQKNLEDAQEALNKLKNATTVTDAFKQLKTVLSDIIDDSTITELEYTEENLEHLKTIANQFEIDNIKEALGIFENIRQPIEETAAAVDNMSDKIERADSELEGMTRREQDIESLKNRMLEFFSIGNAVQLFRQAINSAFETVKELDAAMTETATVTNFTVGDMWNELPRYTEMANELGATTLGAYETMTLFYQQGLDTNEAMALGAETMKMARIAGLDYATATDYMTAALRGFNMELDETSAKRVNDVYSELAAITAADTEEISVAMTKTASIANSANMEFETTAAFLSQIIETTRESAETAGTAMKTIVARFSEVKNLQNQGLLTGQDEEGEAIDVNKIQTALRTVGISMTEFFNGTEGLDQVLLRLAEKWGSLDIQTQRYIATTAAGSRQQSRFIAMMQDYERTVELVNAANNSVGASQNQFNKTLESLEAKLNKLTNAWDAFALGIADSAVIKGAVDTLTGILTVINNITDALPGATSGFGKLGIAILGIKVGGNALNVFWSSYKNILKQDNRPFDAIIGGFKAVGNSAKDVAKSGVDKISDSIKNLKNTAKGLSLDFFKKENLPASILGNKKIIDELNETIIKNNELAQFNQIEGNEKLSQKHIEKELAARQKLNEILNSNKLTLDEYNEIMALDLSNSQKAILLSNSEAAIKAREIVLDKTATQEKKELAMAEAAETIQTEKGIIAKLTKLATDKAQIIVNKRGKDSLLGSVAAYALEKMAIDKSNASKILGIALTGLLTAGIYLLVAAVAALGIAIYNSSDTKRLERLSESIEKMGQEASDTKQEIEEISDAKSGLEDLNTTFDSLTKGTKEWKEALIEINQKVLELLTTYPELAKYISTGANGQLTIDSAGFDFILENQYKKLAAISGAQSGLMLQKRKLETDMTFEDTFVKQMQNVKSGWVQDLAFSTGDFLDTGLGKWISGIQSLGILPLTEAIAGVSAADAIEVGATGGFTSEQFTDITAGLAEEGINSYSTDEEIKATLKELDLNFDLSEKQIELFTSKVKQLGTNFDSLATSVLGAKMANETQKDAFIASAASFDDRVSGSEFSNLAQDILKGRTDNLDEELQDEIDELPLSKKKLKKLYREEVDSNISATELSNLDKETMKNAIAAARLNKKYSDSMAGTILELNALKAKLGETSESFSSLNRLFRDGGEGLTSEDIAKLTGGFGESIEDREISIDEAERFATEDLNYTSLESMAAAFDFSTVDDLVNFMQSNIDTAYASLDEAARKLKNSGLQDSISFNNLNLETDAVAGLTTGLVRVNAVSGQEQAVELFDSIKEIMSNLSPDDAQKFAKALGSIDWSNQSDLDNFAELLEGFGVNPKAVSGLSDLNEQISKLANADYKVPDISEYIKTSLSMQKKIKSDEQDRVFEQESYQQLISLLPAEAGNFVKDLDGNYVYIGNSMNSLIAALEENTAAVIGNTIGSLENKLNAIDTIDSISETSGTNLESVLTSNIEGQKSYLANFIAQAKTNNVDLSNLDIEGLGNNTNIGAISPEQIRSIISELLTMQQNRGTIQGDLTTAKAEGQQYDNITGNQTIDSAIAQTQGYGLDTSALGDYAANLQSIKNLSKETAYSVAADNTAMNSGLREIIDSYDSWTALIDKSTGKIKISGAEDSVVFETLKKSVNKMLNTSKDLSDSFWDNAKNMDNLKKAAEGNAEAFEALQKAAGADYLQNMDLASMVGTDGVDEARQAIDSFVSDINDIDIPKLEVGAQWVGDDANKFIGSFNDMARAANMSAGQIQQAVKAMGFNAEITYVKEKRKVPIYHQSQKLINNADGTSTLESGTPVIDRFEEIEGLFPVVKTLTSTGAGGGGISFGNKNAATGNSGGGGGGKKGGGGGGSKKEKWENPYDHLYNLTEDINEQIRIREKLERRYNKILEARKTTADALHQNTLQEIASLRKQEALQKQMLSKRQQELKDYIKDNSSMQQYGTYNWSDNTIEINWSKIDKVTDTDKGEKIEEYISKLEELQDAMDEAQDSLYEIEDDLQEVIERGKDEYFEFEDLVFDTLQKYYQEEIDTMSAVNDSINETNSKLIDSIQNELSKQREERENQKTEEELSDKQRRLIYLQQDTSGANDLEILRLQEEIEQGQQDYTDTLIDQKISKLEEQNEEAAQQRERQITLAQAQLDIAIANGSLWSEVYNLLNTGINGSNGLVKNSDLYNLLTGDEAYTSLSKLSKMEWLEETNDQIALAINYLRVGRQLENLAMSGKKINFTTSDGKTLSGVVAKDGSVTVNGHKYNEVYQTSSGEFRTEEKYVAPKPAATPKPTVNNTPKPTAASKPKLQKGEIVQIKSGEKWYGDSYGGGGSGKAKSGKIKYINTKGKYPYNIDGKGWVKKSSIVGYKTGGLADYTGPAWLDGTPSKPEYILNAEQTKNFFKLSDILSNIFKKDSKDERSGDNYFDIDINVDEIGSNYDVDRIAEQIKQLIYSDGMYRNVNTVRIMK